MGFDVLRWAFSWTSLLRPRPPGGWVCNKVSIIPVVCNFRRMYPMYVLRPPNLTRNIFLLTSCRLSFVFSISNQHFIFETSTYLIWLYEVRLEFSWRTMWYKQSAHLKLWYRGALWWLGGVVVRTLDLRPSRRWFESRSWHCLVIFEIGDRIWQMNYLGM